MSILNKIKPIKNIFSRTSAYTISAILKVPLTKVDDWANGLDSPSKDQAQHIKKINSPLARLKRLLSNILALYFKKCFLFMSARSSAHVIGMLITRRQWRCVNDTRHGTSMATGSLCIKAKLREGIYRC